MSEVRGVANAGYVYFSLTFYFVSITWFLYKAPITFAGICECEARSKRKSEILLRIS